MVEVTTIIGSIIIIVLFILFWRLDGRVSKLKEEIEEEIRLVKTDALKLEDDVGSLKRIHGDKGEAPQEDVVEKIR